MNGNKPTGQNSDHQLWEAYIALFRGPEWTLDLTTPCLEHQCYRIEDIGAAFQRLQTQPPNTQHHQGP